MPSLPARKHSPEHHPPRPQTHHHFQPAPPPPHLPDVALDPLLKIPPLVARAADLPKPSNPRPHRKPRLPPSRAKLVLLERAWPRPHHRHVPQQHVKKLRQLVESRPAQKPPHLRHPRVVRHVK